MSSVVSTILSPVTGAVKNVVGDLSNGYQASSAPIVNPVSQAQLDLSNQNVNQSQLNQADFLRAVQAQNGLQNQSNVFNQLQGVANGTGPNPAQAMLANSTGANVANQNAMMAGQRGASSNPALIARQAAMQGANTQQQAAGQGAALQAQQSLGALNQMGGVAGQQANQLANANQSYTNAALQGQQNAIGGTSNFNNAQVANTSNMNNVNGAQALQQNQAANQMFGNLMGAAGSAMGLAEGGQVTAGGPRSKVGQFFANGGMAAQKVPAMVSPGEKYLPPQDVAKVAEGKANPMEIGEKIPGKPKVGGAKNSYANDTVPKALDEGGIVIPRSITQGKNAGHEAKKFVEAILKKNAALKKD